jgi:hypothetical protein
VRPIWGSITGCERDALSFRPPPGPDVCAPGAAGTGKGRGGGGVFSLSFLAAIARSMVSTRDSSAFTSFNFSSYDIDAGSLLTLRRTIAASESAPRESKRFYLLPVNRYHTHIT